MHYKQKYTFSYLKYKPKIQNNTHFNHLLSLSSIRTVALLTPPNLTPNGNDISTILILNISSFSDIASSVIGIEVSEEAQVTPAGNVKVYTRGVM